MSAILFALILPVLIGMVGLGVEVGYWFSIRRDLQSAADAAAIAADFELIVGSSAATMQTSANTYASRNGYTGTVTVYNPPNTGSYTADASAVQVVLEKSQPLLFSAIMLSSSVTIGAKATARGATVDEACVIALNTVINNATEITGSANVNLNGCGLAVNSSSASAMTVSGSGYFSAPSATIVGDYNSTVSGMAVTNITTNAAAVADPYASLNIGTPGACVAGNTNQTISPSSTVTLTGTTTYCTGLDVRGTLNLNGNTLYLRGGTLNANSTATITGTGTIVLTDNAGSYARINVNGSAAVTITAPTSGTFKGLAIVQDRNAPAGNDNSISGNSTSAIIGAIYFPVGDITYTGNSSLVSTNCTRIIAYTVYFSGNNNLYNNCSAYDYSWPATYTRPVLVE